MPCTVGLSVRLRQFHVLVQGWYSNVSCQLRIILGSGDAMVRKHDRTVRSHLLCPSTQVGNGLKDKDIVRSQYLRTSLRFTSVEMASLFFPYIFLFLAEQYISSVKIFAMKKLFQKFSAKFDEMREESKHLIR